MATRPQRSTAVRNEALDCLLLRVAQRADELARIEPTGGSSTRDWKTWHRAESELLGAIAVRSPRRREA